MNPKVQAEGTDLQGAGEFAAVKNGEGGVQATGVSGVGVGAEGRLRMGQEGMTAKMAKAARTT